MADLVQAFQSEHITRAEVRRRMRAAFAAGLVTSWSVDSTSLWTIDGRVGLSTHEVEQWLLANQGLEQHDR